MNLKLALILSLCGSCVAHLGSHSVGGEKNDTIDTVGVEIAVDNSRATEVVSSTELIPLSVPSLPVKKRTLALTNECNVDESFFKIVLTTDDFGNQTRWVLKQANKKILQGPTSGTKYESNSQYVDGICLAPGTYKLIMFDQNKDGLCCSSGSGGYVGYVDGKKKFGSPAGDKSWRKRVHRFTISPPGQKPPTPELTKPPTRKPSPQPVAIGVVSPWSNDSVITVRGSFNDPVCTSSERKVKVEIKTDKYGSDTTWEIVDAQGNALFDSGDAYGAFESDTRLFCLKKGSSYDFVVRDKWGDGMCCMKGEGYFKVSLMENGLWREVLSGGAFRTKELREVINLKKPTMTQRDVEWLDSHNSRRKSWHTAHGKSYVPLVWSDALKQDAKGWAEELLDSCGRGMWHDPENQNYGENVAGNSGSGSWGAVRSTEDILTRFVEREVDKPYPHNGHLTQVLWRASRYVGCAEASKPFGNSNSNGMCHTQVCRYSRSGNCNMGAYKKANSDDWWLEPMLMDETPCGSMCPLDGCS